jgi:hypothetical protein
MVRVLPRYRLTRRRGRGHDAPDMPTDLPLRCRCGRVRGVALGVSPESSSHVICYCDDCQAFARFLRTPGILDAHGGTDIFQVPPARVRITDGFDAVESMRLSERGLLRWYAGCCRTPIANTVSARVPFVGIIHSFRSHEGDAPPSDDVLAKPVGIWAHFAEGGAPPDAHAKAPLALVARFAPKIFRWWVSGQGRPSPFFDAKTGAPCVTPRVLGAAERETLRRRSPAPS